MAFMNPDASKITEDMAWREIRQGTYRVDVWEQALAESKGDAALAREAYIRLRTQTIRTDMGKMLARHIRTALAEDERRPPDFKSARDLGR
jgi:hypothetical protein